MSRVSFGEFVLDAGRRELLREGRPVPLSPKAFLLLHTLVESRPTALSKAELSERLWPDSFVVDTNLSNLVGEVRAALGDDARRPRFVRTLHQFGYAFSAEAVDHSGSAAQTTFVARLQWRGGRADLSEGEHVIGREEVLTVCLDGPTVSRRHARIRVTGQEAVLEDLGSKNGTYLNGRKLASPASLSDGDTIRIGSVPVKFRVLRPPASTRTTRAR